MVKLGEEHKEEKNQKPRNKWKDFGEFLENYWLGLLIFGWILSFIIGDIGEALNHNEIIVKEKAVVIEILDTYENYKVKYLSDGTVTVVDLGNAAYVIGDTILTER